MDVEPSRKPGLVDDRPIREGETENVAYAGELVDEDPPTCGLESSVAEVADLWFHCLVLLARHGLGPDDVRAELARREGISGIVEKASRKA